MVKNALWFFIESEVQLTKYTKLHTTDVFSLRSEMFFDGLGGERTTERERERERERE